MDAPVIPFDLARMLLGDQPPLVLAEIAVRTLVIYAYALVLLRWIGGRSIAQLSVVEFLLVIALGSAVGDGMLYAEVPLLHAAVVITVVVAVDKAIDYLGRRYDKAKLMVGGSPIEVVRDGRILTDGLVNRGIGGLELMEILRHEGVENLGEVRAAFLEASGQVSIFRAKPGRAGLSIVPPHELVRPGPPGPGDASCCLSCGAVFPAGAALHAPCSACQATGRAAARPADTDVSPRSAR